MASYEVFTDKEDEILITLVSHRPLLYDLNAQGYKNTRIRDKAWSEIGAQLNKRGENCKKHWKNLKDTYLRQKRRKEENGCSPKHPRSKFTQYAELFYYLDSVPNQRSTTNDRNPDEVVTQEFENSQIFIQDEIKAENIQIDDSPSSPTHILPISPSNLQRSPSKSNNRKRRKNRIEPRQKILDDLSKKIEDDEIVSFSEHVKVVLKKLTPLRKLQAKREIFDILIKYELLDVDSDGEKSCPGTPSSCASSID